MVYQHAPTPGAPGIYRHRMLLGELVRRGWHVDLVSSPINYMTGTAPEPYASRSYLVEEIDGIQHHWVRATGDVHRSKRRRLANYLSFASAAAIRASMLPRPDIVWASSPPLTVASVGMLLARRFRRPWIYEVRDLWPESAASVGWVAEESLPYRVAMHRARRYASHAAAVIVPTPGLVDGVRGHGAERIEVISGAVADSSRSAEVRAEVRRELGIDGHTRVLAYVGAHGPANGLGALLDAAAKLQDAPLLVLLAGDGGEREMLEQRIAREGLDNVRMLGSVPKDEVPRLLAASDACLHLLREDPLFAGALPTKVLEYLGAHRPFITNVPGLPAEIAAASGGMYAPDTAALAASMEQFAAMEARELARRQQEAFDHGSTSYGLEASADRLEMLLAAARAGMA